MEFEESNEIKIKTMNRKEEKKMITIKTNEELQKIDNNKIINISFTQYIDGSMALLVVSDEQDTPLNDYELNYIPLIDEVSIQMCSDFLYQMYLKEAQGQVMVQLIRLMSQCSNLKRVVSAFV